MFTSAPHCQQQSRKNRKSLKNLWNPMHPQFSCVSWFSRKNRKLGDVCDFIDFSGFSYFSVTVAGSVVQTWTSLAIWNFADALHIFMWTQFLTAFKYADWSWLWRDRSWLWIGRIPETGSQDTPPHTHKSKPGLSWNHGNIGFSTCADMYICVEKYCNATHDAPKRRRLSSESFSSGLGCSEHMVLSTAIWLPGGQFCSGQVLPPPLPGRAKNAQMKRSLLKDFFALCRGPFSSFVLWMAILKAKIEKSDVFYVLFWKYTEIHKFVFSSSKDRREFVLALSKNSLWSFENYYGSLGADFSQMERVALDLFKEARILSFGGRTSSEWHSQWSLWDTEPRTQNQKMTKKVR